MLAPDLRPGPRNHLVRPRFKPPAKLLVERAVETEDLRNGEGGLSIEVHGAEPVRKFVH